MNLHSAKFHCFSLLFLRKIRQLQLLLLFFLWMRSWIPEIFAEGPGAGVRPETEENSRDEIHKNIPQANGILNTIDSSHAFALSVSFMGRTINRLIRRAMIYSTMVTYSTL